MTSLRTFVALEVDAEGIAKLSSVQAALHASLATQLGSDAHALRPTRLQQMHMTLAFLGETPKSSIELVASKIREISARHAPLVMAADRVCYLPKSSRATAIALSFNDELERGTCLAQELMEGLTPAGFKFERRRFLAHITLLRSRKGLRIPIDMPQVLRSETAQVMLKLQRIGFFASFLEPAGARYERLSSASLGINSS